MIRKVSVLLDFLRWKITDQIAKGKKIITGITAQAAKLPNLPFSVATLTATNTDLDNKSQAASNGDRVAIAARNTAQKLWKFQFKKTAGYVNGIADGDENFILACGLDPSASETSPSHVPDALQHLDAKPIVDHAGSLDISSDAEPNSKAYNYFALTGGVTVRQVGNSIVFQVGGEFLVLLPDTHHHSIMDGVPSGVDVTIGGLGFNHIGTGTLTEGKTVKAL